MRTAIKFPMGRTVTTRGVHAAMEDDHAFAGHVLACLQRHERGDWGDLDDHDQTANARALEEGSRLFSAYETPGMEKIWIITEADRSATTVLFPEEY